MAALALQPSSQTLPPELECYIFEIAAKEDKAAIVQLVRVAKRVQIWQAFSPHISPSIGVFIYMCSRIEPLLYRSITFSEYSTFKKFLSTLDSKRAEFFASSVKAIIITCIPALNVQEKTRIFSVCTGVCDIYDIYAIEMPLPVLSGLRLQRLHANLQMFKTYPPNYFTLPAFAELTHLEVHDYPDFWPAFRFGLLPSLSHLSIVTWAAEEWDDAGVRLVSNALSQCALLRVLVLNVRHPEPEVCESQIRVRLVDIMDPRLVLLHLQANILDSTFWKDWQGPDEFWKCAEECVAEQIRSVIDTL